MIVFNCFIWFITLYFSISLNCKMPQNSSCFDFYYSFWLVIPFVRMVKFKLLLFTPQEFFTSVLADGFHWSLRDSKSLQVSRTHHSILAVLSNAVVWIVSTRPSTSKSSRPFNNPLVTVPNAPITIGTIVTFMFHSFFNSLARSRYLSFFSLSFRFIPCKC